MTENPIITRPITTFKGRQITAFVNVTSRRVEPQNKFKGILYVNRPNLAIRL